jgi:hypothetical protein
MKETTKAALLGAGLATAAFTLPLVNQDARAQETKPIPLAAPPAEQYKILSLVRLENEGTGRMDIELNKLAAEGWRVRTGVGGAVILAR